MPYSKQQIRENMAAKRKALDPEWVEAASGSVIERFRQMEVFRSAGTVALYKAIAGEIILEPLFEICWDAGKKTCIPLFNAVEKKYEMVEIDESTCFKTGHYGILEPVSPRAPLPLSTIDLMAVPGVAFDFRGNRLGRGGGFYDRFLDRFGGVSAAVAFDFQLLPQVPVEEHDLPVEWIVTERKVIKVTKER